MIKRLLKVLLVPVLAVLFLAGCYTISVSIILGSIWWIITGNNPCIKVGEYLGDKFYKTWDYITEG